MAPIDPTSKVSGGAFRSLPSRRVGLAAAAMLLAAGGLSAGWSTLGTQQRKWIFQATPVPEAKPTSSSRRRGPKAWTASGSITTRRRPAGRSACMRSMPPMPIRARR